MKIGLHNNKDFLAGLLLIGVGAGAFYMALDYPFGSTRSMGPGYFPRILAGIAIAFGIVTLLKGVRMPELVKGRWGWKPLAMITLSLVVFGWVVERFGFVPALVALFFISALGGHEFRFKEVAILTVVMTIFAIAVFVVLLGLPYPLIQEF
ncbi:MAG: tripartite tricarboxylate transporter TctB family protein [Betaproteobacteria bacterium]|jgi:hypothetical protein|nr:MAG: hypothetical protein AMJ67_04310 [Betaproteobacteria bacterium SG8_41]UCF74668.1 MAG: tripartite tricarboxylate transporter TctB family protein [Betaproteobacteria bacterium]